MDKLDKIYEICTEHFKEMPCSIQYVPSQYLNQDLCIAALKNSNRTEWEEREIWKFIPDDMLTYKVCLAAASSNRYALEHIPSAHKTAEIYMMAVKRCGKLLQYVPEDHRIKGLCDIAVRNNPDAIAYVPEEIQTDVIKLVKNSYQYIRILFSDSKFKDCFI